LFIGPTTVHSKRTGVNHEKPKYFDHFFVDPPQVYKLEGKNHEISKKNYRTEWSQIGF
jgi:hypothetical protein